jgi:spermidine synthase
VEQVALAGMHEPRAFWVNNSLASLMDGSEPPRYTRYIERLRKVLLDEMGYRDRRILVLGAGGFTLSHREPTNDYTYVDIDPAIRELAEREFLREPIRGRFVVADARRFVADATERFDAVVVDAYSALTSVPGHLVTQEFWRATQEVLAPDGVLFVNLILDQRLASPYARNVLTTIQSVYGPCAVELLFRDRPQGNVLVQCFSAPAYGPSQTYRDERNPADFDRLRSR